MERILVNRFGGPEVIDLVPASARVAGRGRVRVRVTHASVGSTDVLARRGRYLLQPFPGFTPGYDFVGVLETTTSDAAARGLAVGTRVAACLPRMGSHATSILVPPRLLVPVPDALPSEIAAALPLDALSAELALRLARLRPGDRLLVQGASGAVGSLITQRAVAAGHPVLGTASAANRRTVEALGATWLDYRDPELVARVRTATTGGIAAAVDHTGSNGVRAAVASGGTVVRLSFVGRPGRERRDTVTGSLATLSRAAARPRERLVSVPAFVATRPARARSLLAGELDRVASGELRAPSVELVPFADARAAHERVDRGLAGAKVVLEM
ncbi:zinc-binding dehydrogenase [Agromyces sp. H66]|uniref:quinone oxidoreductase family protein n=1 Tax=Agromyces sp. H66 TaxID=2529859 RepID=UPI00145AD968|nr:zinc-binding dehydrogenase [Agromyces sp. H66]